MGITEGAERHGSDGNGEGGLPGYCFFLAANHPPAFAHLMGKTLPPQSVTAVQVNNTIETFRPHITSVVIDPVQSAIIPLEKGAKIVMADGREFLSDGTNLRVALELRDLLNGHDRDHGVIDLKARRLESED